MLSVATVPQEYRNDTRSFDGCSAGTTEIIGNATGSEKAFSNADVKVGRTELDTEALYFPTRAAGGGTVIFDGQIVLSLRVEAADRTGIHRETMRSARHAGLALTTSISPKKIYVVEMPADSLLGNSTLIDALRGIVGGKLQMVRATTAKGDR